eukprot:6470362-Amphidinium_carterae.1
MSDNALSKSWPIVGSWQNRRLLPRGLLQEGCKTAVSVEPPILTELGKEGVASALAHYTPYIGLHGSRALGNPCDCRS